MKSVIILERLGAATHLRYALWAVVPEARRPFYADPAATSAWKDASVAEIDALKTGAVVEQVETISRPGANANQIKADLAARAAAFQAEIDGANEWSRYGSFLENGVWTDAGA